MRDALPYWFDAGILAALGFALFQLAYLGRSIMSTQQSVVDAVVTQLVKARTEIVQAKDELVAKLVDVQAQLDAAGVAEQVDLSELQAVAQSLDDIVPDEIVVEDEEVEEVEEVPVEEPVVDPVPEPVTEVDPTE